MERLFIMADFLIIGIIYFGHRDGVDVNLLLLLLLLLLATRIVHLIFGRFLYLLSIPVLFFFEPNVRVVILSYYLLYALFYIGFQNLQRMHFKTENKLVERDLLLEEQRKERLRIEKNYENERMLLRLEERSRMSQNLHDTIGHSLTGALMQLEAAKVIRKEDPDRADQFVDNARERIRGGVEEIRLALHHLKPGDEQMQGMRIQALLEDARKTSPKTIRWEERGDLTKISTAQWVLLYENIREALTNSFRHSNAKQLDFELTVHQKIITMVIKDYATVDPHWRKGIGLKGIEQRSAEMGGRVLIDTQNGFRLTILLKVEKI